MQKSKKPETRPPQSAPNCFNCQWRPRSEWSILDDEDVRLLDAQKKTSSYQPGQTVFHQGDTCTGVYCILNGAVAVRKTDAQGNTMLLRLHNEGETIGYRDFFSEGVFTTSAEVLEPTRICFIRSDAVRKLLERNPALGLNFLRQVAGELEATEDSLLRTTSLPVRTRMAHLLLALKERFADADGDGGLKLHLPLSRHDIADILGTRPETVARTIQGLESDGIAVFSGRTVAIPDLDLLLDEIEAPNNP